MLSQTLFPNNAGIETINPEICWSTALEKWSFLSEHIRLDNCQQTLYQPKSENGVFETYAKNPYAEDFSIFEFDEMRDIVIGAFAK